MPIHLNIKEVHIHVASLEITMSPAQFSNLKEFIMASIEDVKAAVTQAAENVKTAVQGAVAAESSQIAAKIQELKDKIASGTPITQEDLDQITSSVLGIAPAATGAIDTISQTSGAEGE